MKILRSTAVGHLIPGGTAGSVLFIDANGNLAQANGELHYDPTSKSFLLGTTTAVEKGTMGGTRPAWAVRHGPTGVIHRFGAVAVGTAAQTANAWWDGTDWLSDDDTVGSYLVSNNTATAECWRLRVAPATVGAITWLEAIYTDSLGNRAFGKTSGFGGGSGVTAIANAISGPSSTPSNGGILYVESGALKWWGSSGTVTTIAPA